MTNEEKAELLQRHVDLADAVARAVAYQSPSAIEEYRSGVNRELLAVQAEIDGGPADDTDPQPPAEVPEAQQGIQEGEPVAADPGIVEQSGVEQQRSDAAAEAANPGEVDARGDVGAERPDDVQERGDLNAAEIKPADDNEVQAS